VIRRALEVDSTRSSSSATPACTMLLGIDPSYVGLAPYRPRHAPSPSPSPRASSFSRSIPRRACAFSPIVAGFVGADAVARRPRHAAWTSRRRSGWPWTSARTARCSWARREHLWACSAPAGPALEGAQIRHGMRAALGAIDRVGLDGGDLALHTIGEASAQGNLRLRAHRRHRRAPRRGRHRLDRAHRSRPPRPASAPARLARDHARGGSARGHPRPSRRERRDPGAAPHPGTTSARCSSARGPSLRGRPCSSASPACPRTR
jgi:hypothetical protein